jgi:glutamate dehydrogenase (NAD(P)+)
MSTIMREPITVATSSNFLETVNRNFDAAAAYGTYPAGLLQQIRTCNSLYRFHFPIRKEGGGYQVIEAWRAEHSHHKLPVKGGIRYSPEVDADEVQALAALMTLQMRHCRCPLRGPLGIRATELAVRMVTSDAAGSLPHGVIQC